MPRGRPSRATVYARLDAQLDELNTRLGGLPTPKESEYVWADIWHLEAHHSTPIEGNTLVLREVEALLDQGRAVGSKPLAEYMEVKGYSEAAAWVYSQAHPESGRGRAAPHHAGDPTHPSPRHDTGVECGAPPPGHGRRGTGELSPARHRAVLRRYETAALAAGGCRPRHVGPRRGGARR